MNDEWGMCAAEGCRAQARSQGYCRKHYDQIRASKAPRGSLKRGGVTDEMRAEIRKRSSRFETQTKIAAALGINTKTVARVLKEARAR